MIQEKKEDDKTSGKNSLKNALVAQIEEKQKAQVQESLTKLGQLKMVKTKTQSSEGIIKPKPLRTTLKRGKTQKVTMKNQEMAFTKMVQARKK